MFSKGSYVLDVWTSWHWIHNIKVQPVLLIVLFWSAPMFYSFLYIFDACILRTCRNSLHLRLLGNHMVLLSWHAQKQELRWKQKLQEGDHGLHLSDGSRGHLGLVSPSGKSWICQCVPNHTSDSLSGLKVCNSIQRSVDLGFSWGDANS